MHTPTKRPSQRKRFPIKLVIIILLLVGLGGGAYALFQKDDSAPKQQEKVSSNTGDEQEEKNEEPKVPLTDLQPTLDTWLAGQRASYSIEVFDVANQKVIASHNATTSYFGASLYKMYVAYYGYKNMSNGTFVDEPNYQGSRSKLDCLYLMIKESDSPCGEAMMAELGQSTMTENLKTLGLTGTVMNGITTNAHDFNLILNEILKTDTINQAYKEKLFESMYTQTYQKGLAAGFIGARVESKVGFNLDINYHDAGIITMNDGRKYLVSILSQGQGSPAPIASLARAFNDALVLPSAVSPE